MIILSLSGGPHDGETLPVPGEEPDEAPIVLELERGAYQINTETFGTDHRQYLTVVYEYMGGGV